MDQSKRGVDNSREEKKGKKLEKKEKLTWNGMEEDSGRCVSASHGASAKDIDLHINKRK